MVKEKDLYTLPEAAQALGVTQRQLLEMLAAKEIEGEQDPNSGRWKIPRHAVYEVVPELLPTNQPFVGSQEETTELPTETVQQLIGELDNLQKELGALKRRLEFLQRAQTTAWQKEKELLLGELEQEREERRREREQAESTLQAERDRLLDDQRREHERANELREEVDRLREDLETERSKGSWRRRLLGR